MQNLHRRILSLFLLTLFLVSTLAAPLKDDISNISDEETDAKEVDTPVTSHHEDKDKATSSDTKEERPEVGAPEDVDGEPQGNDDEGQEVTNYQDIQVDRNSKVTSEKKSQEIEGKMVDDEEGEAEEEFEPNIDMGLSEDMLTPAEARELMLELRDPVDVAKFVVETDDADGFLRALRLLLHDGYITPEQAYNLKDEVTLQLRNLLMLQQVELSRALYETYQPGAELEDPNLDMENILYDQEPQPIDFYEYGNMLNQEDAAYGGPTAEDLYEAYQEQIEEESTRAIAEISEILAQRISAGEISPEEGAKIMRKVIQLLPESYWGGSESEMSSESMTSEFLVGDGEEESIGESWRDEDEDKVSDDDERGDEPAEEKEEEEDFEEELLEQGPGGLVREIQEEDGNGDEDAEELEEEAEHLADELEGELLQGGAPIKEKTMKIERPGAKAIVKVGPAKDNDVEMDEEHDLKQKWKEMSLLFKNDIPDDVLLRRLGISLDKGAQDVAAEFADDIDDQAEEENAEEAEAVDN